MEIIWNDYILATAKKFENLVYRNYFACYINSMASVGTKLYRMFFGDFVGKDEFGNKYYRSRGEKHGEGIGRPGTERRWVEYKGLAEPSKVPPYWHAWLHYMSDKIPTEGEEKDANKLYNWQKDYIPNLTGTLNSYRPLGHELNGGSRASATGDYEAWQPE